MSEVWGVVLGEVLGVVLGVVSQNLQIINIWLWSKNDTFRNDRLYHCFIACIARTRAYCTTFWHIIFFNELNFEISNFCFLLRKVGLRLLQIDPVLMISRVNESWSNLLSSVVNIWWVVYLFDCWMGSWTSLI